MKRNQGWNDITGGDSSIDTHILKQSLVAQLDESPYSIDVGESNRHGGWGENERLRILTDHTTICSSRKTMPRDLLILESWLIVICRGNWKTLGMLDAFSRWEFWISYILFSSYTLHASTIPCDTGSFTKYIQNRGNNLVLTRRRKCITRGIAFICHWVTLRQPCALSSS